MTRVDPRTGAVVDSLEQLEILIGETERNLAALRRTLRRLRKVELRGEGAGGSPKPEDQLTIAQAAELYPGLDVSRLQKACQRSGLGIKDPRSGRWLISESVLLSYVRDPRATLANQRLRESTSST